MKAILILLTLTCAGLGGWALWERTTRLRLENELATSITDRERLKKRAVLAQGIKSGVVIPETGPTGLSEKAKELGMSLEEEDGKEPEKKKKNSTLKAPGEKSAEPDAGDLAKTALDPALREELRAESEAILELEYGDFLQLAGLEQKKRREVMKIVKDRSGRRTDLRLKSVDPKTSAADRDAAAVEYTKFAAESDTTLKELLGENYPKFDRFEKSRPERDFIKALNPMLQEKKLPLESATETKLLDALYDTRRDFHFEHDFSDTQAASPGDLSRQNVDRYLQQNEELQNQVRAKAKEILTPEQFEVFVKCQSVRQQTLQTDLQLTLQMTGGAKAADARN